MTEKMFTEREISDVMEEVIREYIQHFVDGRMTFSEFAIIENLVIKIQNGFKELEE